MSKRSLTVGLALVSGLLCADIARAAFVVSGTTPADGALVQPPATYTVTFNEAVNAASLTPGELKVNGIAASAVSLILSDTVAWTIPAAAIPSGNRVLNSVALTGVAGVGGMTLADFMATFTSDSEAPFIVDSSIHDGDTFSPSPFDVTEVVTFSEPMDTAATTAASFDLLGIYRRIHYPAASYSWGALGTQLTIHYDNLPGDAYRLTLRAGGFRDLVGHPLASDFTVDFAIPPIPAPAPALSAWGLAVSLLLLVAVAALSTWRQATHPIVEPASPGRARRSGG